VQRPGPVGAQAAAFHASLPVVDLVVGTALFHRDLLVRRGHGHVDLPRLLEGGVDLVGLTLATRFPDRRGTLSRPHFRLLGLPGGVSDMRLLEALVARVREWIDASGGRLALATTPADLEAVAAGTDGGRIVRAFLGVQGAHALDGDIDNLERLHAIGVRVFGLAHVMDNDHVGSGTGSGAGLSPAGRELVGRIESAGMVLDLAHSSPQGIRDALGVVDRPFLVSHTGLLRWADDRSRWRRYASATRNLSDDDARLVTAAGGVIGLTLSTQLTGRTTLEGLVEAFQRAADLVGVEQLALGSDFDGALPMIIDSAGLPALTAGLLDGGFSPNEVAAIMGGNALRVLRACWS
jgi:membrane dipeptidase